MNIFLLILTICSITYVYLGIYVVFLDKTSLLNRLFLGLTMSMFVWSFAAALAISAYDIESCALWHRMSLSGFFFIEAFAAHFFLEYTHKENLLKKWWIYIIIYLPALLFSVRQFIIGISPEEYYYGSNGWTISAPIDSTWYWAAYIYYVVYMAFCLFICYRLRKEATSSRERKRSAIILGSGILAFIIGTIVNVYVTIINTNIPDISPAVMIIWFMGICYAIVKYKLMVLTPTIAAENIFQTIIDSIILVSPDGLILDANRETQILLEKYPEYLC